MIVRIETGTSFKGAGLYYLHDKREEGELVRLTNARVEWTHALNTLEDEPEAVLAEMRETAANQRFLKLSSGNRIDGRPTEQVVMTVSLSWSPKQKPTRKEMIETAQSFLKHMGWEEHQALLVAHNDTKHPHIHLIINRVHPETGMTIDANWSKNRSQPWAYAYEKDNGRIYCEAREEKYGRRERPGGKHMNYREWRQWQEAGGADPDTPESAEWRVLKETQKQERMGYWKETSRIRKELRADLREQVRQEFAAPWQDYALLKEERLRQAQAYDRAAKLAIHAHRKSREFGVIAGLKLRQRANHAALRHELAQMRKDIGGRQKAKMEALAGPALDRLRKERLEAFEQVVLARHRAERAELRDDQDGARSRGIPHAYDALRAATAGDAQADAGRASTAARKRTPTLRDFNARSPAASGGKEAREAHREGASPMPQNRTKPPEIERETPAVPRRQDGPAGNQGRDR